MRSVRAPRGTKSGPQAANAAADKVEQDGWAAAYSEKQLATPLSQIEWALDEKPGSAPQQQPQQPQQQHPAAAITSAPGRQRRQQLLSHKPPGWSPWFSMGRVVAVHLITTVFTAQPGQPVSQIRAKLELLRTFCAHTLDAQE